MDIIEENMTKEDQFPTERTINIIYSLFGGKVMDTNLSLTCQSPYSLCKTDKTPMVLHKDEKHRCIKGLYFKNNGRILKRNR